MIASLPVAAPATPPDTGASIDAMPRAPSSCAMALAAAGPEVDRSMKICRPEADAIASAVARATVGVGTLAMTIGAAAATSPAELAATAPLATAAATAPGSGS